MDRSVNDSSVLVSFINDFVRVLEARGIKYALVSGFVAIAHGRSRGTEDIDVIVEKLSANEFESLFGALASAGFECIQGGKPGELYADYLAENSSLRFVRAGEFVPEMELKLSKDALDEKQLAERTKLPLTGLPFYFSTIETNIAFKEELLKSPKDIADSRHLRTVYEGEVDEGKVGRIKTLIRKYRIR